MGRKLNEKQMQELEKLKRECDLILDFFEKRSPLVHWARVGIEKAYQARDLISMRVTRRDHDGWIRDLPPQERKHLETLLAEQLGSAIVDTVGAERKRLQEILNRGRIRNEDEYRSVLERVEEIFTDSAAADEVHVLNEMLAEFERE